MTWSSRVIDELHALKGDGVGFDEAWRAATRKHKPSTRAEGYRETLFVSDPEDESASEVEFLYAVCSDAWFGRRPVLRHLAVGLRLLEDAADDSREARARHTASLGQRTAA